MSLVPSLLNAILRLDGEALVMHVGEKPYVVAPSGQVELASRPLNFEAVSGMVSELLPPELQQALDEFGAVQYEFPHLPEFSGENFSVVAARGGEDVWVEVRRRRVPDDDSIPEELFLPVSEPSAALPAAQPPRAAARPAHDVVAPAPPTGFAVSDQDVDRGSDLDLPHSEHLWPTGGRETGREHERQADAPREWTDIEAAFDVEALAQHANTAPELDLTSEVVLQGAIAPPSAPVAAAPLPNPIPAPVRPEPVAPVVPLERPVDAHPVELARAPAPPHAGEPIGPAAIEGTRADARAIEAARPVPSPARVEPIAPPATVLPLTRSPIRTEPSPAAPVPRSGLDRLLRIAAARAASALYLTSQALPSIRIDGEIQQLAGEAVLSPADVESLLIDLMPERNREELRSGIATEWIADLSEVGRVRCMTFRDHRGAGGIFRMMPLHAISADQLGLSREIQALAAEPEGFVLVTGPRASGKSTLVSAFVDLVNRTRCDHVITIESDIKVVHEQRHSLVSQREVRGSADEMLGVARSALRENPDVLVFEELRTADLVAVALEAAESGRLVIGALPAHTTTAAIDRMIDFYPPEQRRHVQLSIAEHLRGVVAQVLVRKRAGGRAAAREVLLNTPAVAGVIAEGKTSQLPAAIDGGRKYGMMSLTDALVGLVQNGTVDPREACRQAADRAAVLAILRREGIDTSSVDKLA